MRWQFANMLTQRPDLGGVLGVALSQSLVGRMYLDDPVYLVVGASRANGFDKPLLKVAEQAFPPKERPVPQDMREYDRRLFRGIEAELFANILGIHKLLVDLCADDAIPVAACVGVIKFTV